MSAPPKTVLEVSAEEADAIRAAVRGADLRGLGGTFRRAEVADAAGLLKLLQDPSVSDPIYDLPRPFALGNVRAWIETSEAERQRGEGLLALSWDEAGAAISYIKVTVWPDRSAAELAGAVRADRQNRGGGATGAARNFGWMFDTLSVRLIGLTAALDNIRSAKVIEAAGFQSMGERDSVRSDGTIRRSYYWEMTRDAWRARWG